MAEKTVLRIHTEFSYKPSFSPYAQFFSHFFPHVSSRTGDVIGNVYPQNSSCFLGVRSWVESRSKLEKFFSPFFARSIRIYYPHQVKTKMIIIQGMCNVWFSKTLMIFFLLFKIHIGLLLMFQGLEYIEFGAVSMDLTLTYVLKLSLIERFEAILFIFLVPATTKNLLRKSAILNSAVTDQAADHLPAEEQIELVASERRRAFLWRVSTFAGLIIFWMLYGFYVFPHAYGMPGMQENLVKISHACYEYRDQAAWSTHEGTHSFGRLIWEGLIPGHPSAFAGFDTVERAVKRYNDPTHPGHKTLDKMGVGVAGGHSP